MFLKGIRESGNLFGIDQISRKQNDPTWTILLKPLDKLRREFRTLEPDHQELSDSVTGCHREWFFMNSLHD